MRTWVRLEGDHVEPHENASWVLLDDGSWLTFFANGRFEHRAPDGGFLLRELERSGSFEELL